MKNPGNGGVNGEIVRVRQRDGTRYFAACTKGFAPILEDDGLIRCGDKTIFAVDLQGVFMLRLDRMSVQKPIVVAKTLPFTSVFCKHQPKISNAWRASL